MSSEFIVGLNLMNLGVVLLMLVLYIRANNDDGDSA